MSKHERGRSADPKADTLSSEETATLLFTIEEEKLAGDIYEAFAELYDARIFTRIAASEDRHFDALLRQADRLGVDTSDLPDEAGVYADAELQALYDSLLAEGAASYTAALEVGVFIEVEDLIDLQAAQDETDDAKLDRTYASLEAGSENHLDAFLSALDPWA